MAIGTAVVMHCAGCCSIPVEPPIGSGSLVAGFILDNFKSRAWADDEDFVSDVFEMGNAGFRMALSHVNEELVSGRLERDTPAQRKLYLWIEALSAFYWPAVYNADHFRKTYGQLIEKCFFDVLNNDNPAIHESMMAFLLINRNLATGPMVRRAAELCASDDAIVAELATHFCTIFFFAPEDTPGAELVRLRSILGSDMDLFMIYWRHPPIKFAPPTRESLRAITVQALQTDENAVKDPASTDVKLRSPTPRNDSDVINIEAIFF
jgi:hypothetical protein